MKGINASICQLLIFLSMLIGLVFATYEMDRLREVVHTQDRELIELKDVINSAEEIMVEQHEVIEDIKLDTLEENSNE